MLLIHPPIAKPSEPPAGIAKLSGALHAHGIAHRVLDSNIEGILFLLKQPRTASDTWTRRAIKNLPDNIAELRNIRTYQSFDHYSRTARDLNRVLAISSKDNGVILGLADYHHQRLSPIRSADLIFAAEHPEQNPFYEYFRERLPEIVQAALLLRNCQEQTRPPEDMKSGKRKTAPVIGISLNYLSQALCAFAMIGFMKREFPSLKIALGGGLVSSWMKRPGWKNVFDGLVDHLVAGPGEQPLLDLFDIAGTRQECSMPDYSLLPLHDYLSPGLILPYSGSSGCYWHKCSFCPETAEDNPYVPVPAHQALTHLHSLIGKTKPVLVHLLDNAISPALMRALADRPISVPWYGFVKADSELLDLNYCIELKKAGCVMLKIGLESGDQEVLDTMRKGIDLVTMSHVLHNLHKAGIAIYVYLLFGTPPETIIEARRTLDYVVKHAHEIGFLNLAIFNLPLSGQMSREIETTLFYEGDLSLYTGFTHPRGWNREIVRRFLDKEFKRHPAISPILKNDPPFFTSNHAAFFIKR
jgi:radical SAM superfamily enzyme YgiQ (UPF0313 family)